jgi:hypothetical protein
MTSARKAKKVFAFSQQKPAFCELQKIAGFLQLQLNLLMNLQRMNSLISLKTISFA